MFEPWVCFEDEHLLVVAKPSGVNTHRADVHAQDGMYEWVQRRRSADSLSILHRLDKATSGLLVFGKSTRANQSLATQFETRSVAKRYELLVAHDANRGTSLRCDQPIGPAGRGHRDGRVGRDARTDFERQAEGTEVDRYLARPHSGRTHQVRIHAATLDMPIIGDVEHDGAPGARLFLHAAGLSIDHPTDGPFDLALDRPASFDQVLDGEPADGAFVAAQAALEERATLFDPADTNAFVWIDRHHDGFDGVRVELLGDIALVLNYDAAAPLREDWLDAWNASIDLRAVYEQRRPRGGGAQHAQVVRGSPHHRFHVVESGLAYLIDLEASTTSSGLFLDQRETRRALATMPLRGKTVLNTFAHTGSLSVAAASAGAQTLTLDLSRRYLDWARENFRLNAVDPAEHDFVYGDANDWMDRFAKKGRRFDVVLIDPPSSSTGKRGAGRWLVERDLHALVERGARLCAPGGQLFVSTNLHRMRWPGFLDHLDRGITAAGRAGTIETQTLPLDHRSGPGDPPYLKAAWVSLDVA